MSSSKNPSPLAPKKSRNGLRLVPIETANAPALVSTCVRPPHPFSDRSGHSFSMTNPSRHAVAAIARTSRSQRGFALLITITLLAFLVLLLV
jgi:hypothetical protein